MLVYPTNLRIESKRKPGKTDFKFKLKLKSKELCYPVSYLVPPIQEIISGFLGGFFYRINNERNKQEVTKWK